LNVNDRLSWYETLAVLEKCFPLGRDDRVKKEITSDVRIVVVHARNSVEYGECVSKHTSSEGTRSVGWNRNNKK
jgi:hypothetical protein